MDIIDRNEMIKKLKNEIKEKQENLHNKFKELEKNNSEKTYLAKVKSDYEKYLDFIKKIKENQLNAFENINKYLNRIEGSLKSTNTLLKENKNDQKIVISEINKLKKELYKITN